MGTGSGNECGKPRAMEREGQWGKWVERPAWANVKWGEWGEWRVGKVGGVYLLFSPAVAMKKNTSDIR